jgi:hypothetical protein
MKFGLDERKLHCLSDQGHNAVSQQLEVHRRRHNQPNNSFRSGVEKPVGLTDKHDFGSR